jgi:DNA repair photolyase
VVKKLTMVDVPSLKRPIQQSPGFAKKLLADHKLDLMGRCGFECTYCSSDTGRALMTRMPELVSAVEKKTGEYKSHLDDSSIVYVWPDVLQQLEKQLCDTPKWIGRGKTLILSMLTDPFSPPLTFPTRRTVNGLVVCENLDEVLLEERKAAEALGDHYDEDAAKGPPATLHALRLLLERTEFRIRILTKSATVATGQYLTLLKANKGRVVVGLSIGTLDNSWARAIEKRATNPTKRLEALNKLQAEGVPTFGMLCPVFPDVLESGRLEALIDAIRPDVCEHVWAEPYNDRGNWQVVRDAYPKGSVGYEWFERMFGQRGTAGWSEYATELYDRLRFKAKKDGWMHKLRYLLYEQDITASDAQTFQKLEGVLLQGKVTEEGLSTNESFATFEKATGAGRVRKGGG